MATKSETKTDFNTAHYYQDTWEVIEMFDTYTFDCMRLRDLFLAIAVQGNGRQPMATEAAFWLHRRTVVDHYQISRRT